MRAIYTSPRLANVERVAQLLVEHGIAAHVTREQTWSGRRNPRFSYFGAASTQRGSWARVHVVDPDDRAPARQLLRELGISAGGIEAEIERLAISDPRQIATARRRRVVTRIRLALLVAIGVFAALITLGLFGI